MRSLFRSSLLVVAALAALAVAPPDPTSSHDPQAVMTMESNSLNTPQQFTSNESAPLDVSAHFDVIAIESAPRDVPRDVGAYKRHAVPRDDFDSAFLGYTSLIDGANRSNLRSSLIDTATTSRLVT